jgi:hypothetical protein
MNKKEKRKRKRKIFAIVFCSLLDFHFSSSDGPMFLP